MFVAGVYFLKTLSYFFTFLTASLLIRVTQVYDVGACIYFYFGFNYRDIEPRRGHEESDPREIVRGLEIYEEIEV